MSTKYKRAPRVSEATTTGGVGYAGNSVFAKGARVSEPPARIPEDYRTVLRAMNAALSVTEIGRKVMEGSYANCPDLLEARALLERSGELNDLIRAGKMDPKDRAVIAQLSRALLRAHDSQSVVKLLKGRDALLGMRLLALEPRLLTMMARASLEAMLDAFSGIIKRAKPDELKGVDYLIKTASRLPKEASQFGGELKAMRSSDGMTPKRYREAVLRAMGGDDWGSLGKMADLAWVSAPHARAIADIKGLSGSAFTDVLHAHISRSGLMARLAESIKGVGWRTWLEGGSTTSSATVEAQVFVDLTDQYGREQRDTFDLVLQITAIRQSRSPAVFEVEVWPGDSGTEGFMEWPGEARAWAIGGMRSRSVSRADLEILMGRIVKQMQAVHNDIDLPRAVKAYGPWEVSWQGETKISARERARIARWKKAGQPTSGSY